MNVHLITFICGNTEYGIDIKLVDCIIPKPEKITKLPAMKEYMKGIIQLRDTVIPIIDLRILLDHKIETDTYKIVVVIVNDNKLGFIIDEISHVINLDADIQLPETFKENKYVTGVVNTENKTVILLDSHYIGKILSDV